MAIALTRHAFGDDLAAALAAVLQPDPQRERATRTALQDRRIPTTRTSVLAHAIAWLETRVEQPYDLRALADAVSASPRTLLRHFQQELGHSPLDHLHRLRCARARVLLEITLESVPSVALACGYEDASAFRRVFVRYVGMTPAAYRERHALRAPRRRCASPPAKFHDLDGTGKLTEISSHCPGLVLQEHDAATSTSHHRPMRKPLYIHLCIHLTRQPHHLS
ncbi:L-rhamnose operon transcriptional activator rhaR [Comamonas testosteroni]|uniref:L-rhamnose operon transcriptional activator rhaR n=1 Tax=Comamonas testosteroni TaxID=285 RepID=A0A8B4SA18_COMTE|nr:L-rhamnose operon transcriptional activator rhaR [Comamonas testosteroni]